MPADLNTSRVRQIAAGFRSRRERRDRGPRFERFSDLFKKTIWNCLRLIPQQLGFLIDFNEAHLKSGITRITNGAEGKSFY